MAYEIIYKCNSKNNKNIREGELNILRKFEEKLYFEFGENEINVKKRFYDDVETLNKDFEFLKEYKENPPVIEEEEKVEDINAIKDVANLFIKDELLTVEEVNEIYGKDLSLEKNVEPKKEVEKVSSRRRRSKRK